MLCESAQFEGLPETYELLTSWVLKNILPDFLSLNQLPSELSSFKADGIHQLKEWLLSTLSD